MRCRVSLAFLSSLALLSAGVPPLHAQQPTRIDGLGSLAFPNSGSPEAQHDFIRGVLLLHSFEYADAATAFRKAQEIDPDFAMAYWGEAMTYTHPVWNQKDPTAAMEALARYAPTPQERAEKAPTDRERAYLTAADVLYGHGMKATLDTLFSLEMERLAARYPEDLEAQTFYALSLLGLSQGDRNVPTYIEAGAIALAAVRKNPEHPGAAHYVIHSFDDPTHAILAMPAARAYGPIAPDAAHAQHMTTHIFLARGLWDDVVETNVRADALSDRSLEARGLPPRSCGHYNEWLMYGYQQQGRYEDAETLLMGCHAQVQDELRSAGRLGSSAESYAHMRSLHLADTRDWTGVPAISPIGVASAPMFVQLMEAWGSGVAAVNRGDRTAAKKHHAFLMDYGANAGATWESPYVPVWQGTLGAMLLADAGDGEGALRAAHEAAEYEASLPVDFGPPIAFKPARELEAELLLDQGRAEDAMRAFEMALARTPNRILSLAGYAGAAVAAGRTDLATRAYGKLAHLLRNADAGMKEGREAKAWR
ncbi:MAG: hypothetical protein IH968_07850 [Gemmatimonadetes bacterium]|nr:hypothetical protein [Gemmatimonadota bacterium]